MYDSMICCRLNFVLMNNRLRRCLDNNCSASVWLVRRFLARFFITPPHPDPLPQGERETKASTPPEGGGWGESWDYRLHHPRAVGCTVRCPAASPDRIAHGSALYGRDLAQFHEPGFDRDPAALVLPG